MVKFELGSPPPGVLERSNREVLEEFLASLLAAGASEKTVRVYRAAIEDFLEFIGDKPLRLVSGEDVRRWRMERLRKGFPRKRRNRRNSDPVEERRWRQMTLHYYTLLLRGFFEWLGLSVRVPVVKAPRRREVEALSEQEVYLLLNASRDVLDVLIVALLVETGLRAQEALELRWRDIDFNSGEIRVRAAKYGEERIVFYGPLTRQALIVWFNEKKPRSLDERVLGLSYSGLYKRLKSLAKRAGLDPRKIRPHVLRHTFATQALRKGMSLIAVQRLLGHRDVKVTQVYTHLLKEDLRLQYTAAFGNGFQPVPPTQVQVLPQMLPYQQPPITQPVLPGQGGAYLPQNPLNNMGQNMLSQPYRNGGNSLGGQNQVDQRVLRGQGYYMQFPGSELAQGVQKQFHTEPMGQSQRLVNGGGESKVNSMIICPYCGASIPADSIYCPRCGARLKP